MISQQRCHSRSCISRRNDAGDGASTEGATNPTHPTTPFGTRGFLQWPLCVSTSAIAGCYLRLYGALKIVAVVVGFRRPAMDTTTGHHLRTSRVIAPLGSKGSREVDIPPLLSRLLYYTVPRLLYRGGRLTANTPVKLQSLFSWWPSRWVGNTPLVK